jgi:hypothetical protein
MSNPIIAEWDILFRKFAQLDASPRNELNDFAALLAGFTNAEEKTLAADHTKATHDLPEFAGLIDGYSSAFQRWRTTQTGAANDFNLVELFRLTGDENRHSDVLAWLLNADVYTATHSQGNLGFRIFCRHLHLPESYADDSYYVRREVSGDESRVDIEIASYGKFVIHIESKIHSKEGDQQTQREWDDLKRRANRELGNAKNIHAFFLTRGGTNPICNEFKPLKWKEIASIFEEFANEAKAPSIRWFALHYAEAILKFIAQPDEKERANAEENIQ